MKLTRSQVEEVRLKGASILRGSRKSHKVVIGFRPMWKFLSPSRKCSIFCCTKLFLLTECQRLAGNSILMLPAAWGLFRFCFWFCFRSARSTRGANSTLWIVKCKNNKETQLMPRICRDLSQHWAPNSSFISCKFDRHGPKKNASVLLNLLSIK